MELAHPLHNQYKMACVPVNEFITEKGCMSEMMYFLIFLGIYILVQVYILPKMGIST